MRRLRVAVVILTALGAVGSGIAVPAAAAPTVSVIRVAADEWSFRVRPLSVPRGPVVFHVRNAGTIQHNFWVAGKRTPRIAPGGSVTVRVDFRRPGRRMFLCTLNSHAEAGMRGELTVG